MSTLPITPSLIPPLTGRTALITGGSSEITLSTALLLAEKGCSKVTILDPEHNDSLLTPDPGIPSCLAFLRVDVRNWKELKAAVKGCGEVDYAFYVPGPERILFEVGGEGDDDREGENGVGMDWAREVRTVGDFVKVCWAVMARSGVGRLGDEKGKGGSVVICVPGGAGGYMSCHVLPPVGMPGEGVMDGCAGSAVSLPSRGNEMMLKTRGEDPRNDTLAEDGCYSRRGSYQWGCCWPYVSVYFRCDATNDTVASFDTGCSAGEASRQNCR